MQKITLKVAIPVILAGIFAIIVFISINYERLEAGLLIVLFLLAIFVFFFGFSVGQNFASPIRKLLERANELSRGNLSSRVYLETKDELAELAKVFNKIAEDLETSKNQEQKTEKSVDIRVRARTQELEETINALEQKVKNRTIEHERLMAEAQKLQQEMKEKEEEMAVLKREVGGLKVKTEKPKEE